MSASETLTLYHAPQTRSTGVLTLLEELRAPYQLHVLNMKKGEQRQPPYLAVNPMGKVPAVVHRGAVVTEQVAIFNYLADLFPEAGLAPALNDPDRGPYLRWLAFYGSCFEPAVIDRALKRDAGRPQMSAYGDFDTTVRTVTDQLERGTYLLGDRFSAADVLWGASLGWITAFKLIPETPVVAQYVERVTKRPAAIKAGERDAALAAEQEAAAAAT